MSPALRAIVDRLLPNAIRQSEPSYSMAILKKARDELLVEARHRCTICSEKCFELHHIIEQADGGTDDADNLIVLCPNCHQHRYHRSGEFTRDQLRLYKQKLKESAEVERRLLQNLEDLRARIGVDAPGDVEAALRIELSEAAAQVVAERAPGVQRSIDETARFLAEREELRGGARTAIEVEWEIERARAKAEFPEIQIVGVDDAAYRKASEFPAAYEFVLILNLRPNSVWIQAFDMEYRISWYHMKRTTRVRSDRIVMVIADSDNLQGHVDFAKQLVQRTNATIQRDIFHQIDSNINQGKRHALEQFDAIKSMKTRTRDLRL